MKKSSLISTLVLFAAAMMLSGCIFPYWGDEGYGGGHGGGRGGEHHHEGGGRR